MFVRPERRLDKKKIIVQRQAVFNHITIDSKRQVSWRDTIAFLKGIADKAIMNGCLRQVGTWRKDWSISVAVWAAVQ